MKFIKFLVAAMIAVFAVGSLAGCAAESRVVTDSGHLEGVLLIPIASSSFDAQLEELDKAADYFIYCRSGNRAGQAIDRMIDAGFTGELVNGGSVANASSILGLEVVTD
jgi:phage shock protein E